MKQEKNVGKQEKKLLDTYEIYLLLFMGILLLFIITGKLGLHNNIRQIQIGMSAAIMFLGAACSIMLYKKNKKAFEILLFFIITAGCIMRIGYMLYTTFVVRGHDIGYLDINDCGHAAYIMHFLEGKGLPDEYVGQFYHPPLFHYLAAKVIQLVQLFLKKETLYDAMEGAKIISCFASCGVLFLTRSLCKELKMGKRAVVTALTVTAFLPNFYLLAGRVNNDSLVIFFMMLALLYTVKWYNNQSWSNIVVLALAFGMGMMTKISCGVMALFTGPIMLLVLYRKWKDKAWKTTAAQFAAFAFLCFPLALWSPIRNLICLGQPLGYVLDLGSSSFVYCGDIPYASRLLVRLPLYLLRTALFGEFTYDIPGWVQQSLFIVNGALVILALAALVYLVVKGKKENFFIRYGFAALWGILCFSHVVFNIKYPYICTMDFRYIVPTAILGGIVLGTVCDRAEREGGKSGSWINNIVTVLLVVFSVFSVVMYCNIG